MKLTRAMMAGLLRMRRLPDNTAPVNDVGNYMVRRALCDRDLADYFYPESGGTYLQLTDAGVAVANAIYDTLRLDRKTAVSLTEGE